MARKHSIRTIRSQWLEWLRDRIRLQRDLGVVVPPDDDRWDLHNGMLYSREDHMRIHRMINKGPPTHESAGRTR